MVRGLRSGTPVDAIFVNSPLKNYDLAPRFNDFTLPVLGLAYIATCAQLDGLNVGILDAEAAALGISRVVAILDAHQPRWVGLNLLAPTYRHSVDILRRLQPEIKIMLGGHQAKAMPQEILNDQRIPRIDALILGEGEHRAVAVLKDITTRVNLPGVWWRGEGGALCECHSPEKERRYWLSPDLETLPFINRALLSQDPFAADDGRIESNLVGSRGCPFNCSFCGAAASANPDVTIRTRSPENIIREMQELSSLYHVNACRFVDDLFLTSVPFMKRCLPAFKKAGVGKTCVWDATGRINVLHKVDSELLDLMVEAGCREIALGIESGSERVLAYMDKHITPAMTMAAVKALTARGINVKGYFILGFPTETREEMEATVRHIRDLWQATDGQPGAFRCSVFEFRPYPGTPEWHRLLATGAYTVEQLLLYEQVDLTDNGAVRSMLERDEFNFAVNVQFGEVPVEEVRRHLTQLTVEQKQRLPRLHDRVQRSSFG